MPPVTAQSVRAYKAHQTARMQELEGLELASFWQRAIVFAIDFVFAGALFLVLFLLAVKVLPRTIWGEHDVHIELDFFHNWYSVVYLVAFFSLFTDFGNGRTPGKRIMGIRVVSLVHHRLSLWHSIERSLGYGASALELGFGFVQFFIERNRRTVHTSFPSGHSIPSALTYLTMEALLARSYTRKRIKAFLLCMAVLLTGLVGVSRVYLGVHWPTDVLAGWTAGATWAALCWLVARWLAEPAATGRAGLKPVTGKKITTACRFYTHGAVFSNENTVSQSEAF